jgi:hypothetical protein
LVNRDDDLLFDCLLLVFQFIDNRNREYKIQSCINRLVKYLYGKYRVYRDDIEGYLSKRFIERRRHLKYDPERSSLEIYVGYFVYYGLLDLICECQRHRERCLEVPLSQLNFGERVSTAGRPAENFEDFGIEGLTNRISPEDEIIGKELMELADGFFEELDLAVLLGAVDRKTAAQKMGRSYVNYRKHLNRQVARFRSFIKDYGYDG